MSKLINTQLVAALAAAAALVGCSAGSNSGSVETEPQLGKVGAQLRVVNADGIVGTTTSVNYSLSCGGSVVKAGVVPVPLDGSTISGFFGSVAPATGCSVELSTTVSFSTGGSAVCAATSPAFDVTAGQLVDLGSLEIACDVNGGVGDVTFAANISLVSQSLDTFFVGPLSIVEEGGVVPPVSLSIAQPIQSGVSYAWSAAPSSAGTFVGCDVTPENCEFLCAESGSVELVLTGNFGGSTLSRSATVTCDVVGGGTGGAGGAGGAAGGAGGEPAGGAGGEPAGGAGGSGPVVTACNQCLNTDENLPPNYNGACTDIAECAAVRECVVDSNCYQVGKSPSECYCGVGVDINDCQAPSFVPTGACVPEIVAAMTRDGEALTNANMVGVLASDATTSGKAFQILIAVSQAGICVPECTLAP